MKDILIAIFAPTIAAGVTYFVARRISSGRVATSDASDLWTESQSMRRELRDEVKELRSMITDLKQKIDALETEKFVSIQKIIELQQKVELLKDKVKKLENKI